MKRIISGSVAVIMVLTLLIPFTVMPASAATYRTGANSVSSSYAGGKYYQYYQQIPITGDGVTDVLAVALSQLGYTEGTSTSNMAGDANTSGNYTEYNYNMGKSLIGAYGGSSYPWCASFVSWCLYQSYCTNQGSESDLCRNHVGNSNYIWREIGCGAWINNLKSAGRFNVSAAKGGSYVPKAGDLIFFREGGHIGLVLYVQNGYVYTVEGNTSDAAGLETNGGGVYFKSYSLTYASIDGYGVLPYNTNSAVKRVDYSGANPTAGLWITNTTKYLYADEACTTRATYSDGVYCNLYRFTMFNAVGVTSDKKALKVNYDGLTGYIALNDDRVIQITSSASAEEDLELPGNVAAGRSYQTSLLYRQGGEDVEWAYDASKPINYDDEEGVTLTDGKIAADNEYTNPAWAGLHYNTPDAADKGYAWVTVDLGNVYDITECSLYVPIENFTQNEGVVRPGGITFWASTDGVNYNEIGTAGYKSINDCTDAAYVTCNVKARYIEARIVHGGWIFVSEIAAVGTLSTGGTTPTPTPEPDPTPTPDPDPEHTHKPYEQWTSDESGHWFECDCGEVIDFAEHNCEWIISEESETTEEYICIDCGFVADRREIQSQFILGDVNESGDIDMMDYVLLKRNYFGTFEFTEKQLSIGDVNHSEVIDMMDYVLLKRAYFGTFVLN